MIERRCGLPLLCAIAVAAGLLGCQEAAFGQGCQPFKVLVFTKTAGFNHGPQIVAGTALIQSMGAANGFQVDTTADATLINPSNLGQYAVVIFLHTTGDILDATQEAAFQSYILAGGGFVGVHSATDTEYGWPFYGSLIGAYFLNHPAIQTATVNVADANHPSTASLPASFSHTDEWYNFQTNVATNPLVHVLLTVDETTYTGGSMGAVHPIAWYQDNPGMGRSWYTAMGHDLSTYTAAFFQSHLLGGILWAAGSARTRTICGGQPYGTGSGSPPLTLGASPLGPGLGSIDLTGASSGATGVIALSACQASMPAGGFTVLVDLGSPGLLGLFPIAFDAAGHFQLIVPLTLSLPGAWGNSLYLQGAQIGATIGVSNGLNLVLCP
jgi:cytochrome c